MDNYAIMARSAAERFLTYDIKTLTRKPGVEDCGTHLAIRFLGERVLVSKATGIITFPERNREANFEEALTVYDWLCDRKETAKAAWEFCPVSSLPGVLVRGNGLMMTGGDLPAQIDKNPGAFLEKCRCMGGKPLNIGDMGVEILAFPDLPLRLKFYHSDEDFPASLTLLWDKNTLNFIRYETVYYLAGCLFRRLGGEPNPGRK